MSAGYTERQGVITANTTVYSEPTTSAARLLVLKPGELVQGVEVHGGGWLTTFLPKGGSQVQGYFQASNLELFGQSNRIDRGAVIRGPMHARIAPSSSAEIIHTYPDGANTQFGHFNDSWGAYQLTIDGKRVVVYSPLSQILVYDPPHQDMFSRTLTKDVPARAAPWSGASIVTTFTSGTTLQYLKYHNADWVRTGVGKDDENVTTVFLDLRTF